MKHPLVGIYIILIATLVALPHIISGHVFFLSRENTESLATILVLIIAYATFRAHTYLLKKKEKEREYLLKKLKTSGAHLADSYRYIGEVNRKLALMHDVTTRALEHPTVSKRDRKHLIEALLATATYTVAKAPWGLLRIVCLKTKQTEREFFCDTNAEETKMLHISNKSLIAHNHHKEKLHLLNDTEYIMRSSDAGNDKQCFFIFPKEALVRENDVLLLQSITDQMKLFYKYLY